MWITKEFLLGKHLYFVWTVRLTLWENGKHCFRWFVCARRFVTTMLSKSQMHMQNVNPILVHTCMFVWIYIYKWTNIGRHIRWQNWYYRDVEFIVWIVALFKYGCTTDGINCECDVTKYFLFFSTQYIDTHAHKNAFAFYGVRRYGRYYRKAKYVFVCNCFINNRMNRPTSVLVVVGGGT